ncbi:MAG TPA: hypothetical protein PLN41_00590 [Methanothrix sp.]|nr:hypothetical protein [Methanothrix sp.]HNT72371.1 hypothetical protein [Methanothrix sp.]HOI68227.1 hypothetical protein [Methanothrix sp.]HPY72784.1 hypothetical protein [Methanothrix sp.]
MKCAVMIMLACLVGVAAGEGYTTTQNIFLMGGNPVRTSMEESRFPDYADMYWASYLSNPDSSPMTPVYSGLIVDIENTMAIWRINFPFNISSSSFGDGTEKSAEAVSPRYDFGIGTYWRYTGPMPVDESSFDRGSPANLTQVQRNTQFLSQEITRKFGL